MSSLVTLHRTGRVARVTWGAEDAMPHPASEAVNLTAAGFGMEEAITAWRQEHREALRWRSSFSYGGGRGVARVPAPLAQSLAGVLAAFFALAELVEGASHGR